MIFSDTSRMTQNSTFYDQKGILSIMGSYLTLSQCILALDMTPPGGYVHMTLMGAILSHPLRGTPR